MDSIGLTRRSICRNGTCSQYLLRLLAIDAVCRSPRQAHTSLRRGASRIEPLLAESAAMAEAVRPGRLIIEIQFLEAQIESPNYIDNQLGVLFGLVDHFFPFSPLTLSTSSIVMCQPLILLNNKPAQGSR